MVWLVFGAVFVAELGDKTQLATLMFATDAKVSKLAIFLGASLALVAASGLGVVAGAALGQWVSPRLLRWVAGLGFIAIGALTLWRG